MLTLLNVVLPSPARASLKSVASFERGDVQISILRAQFAINEYVDAHKEMCIAISAYKQLGSLTKEVRDLIEHAIARADRELASGRPQPIRLSELDLRTALRRSC